MSLLQPQIFDLAEKRLAWAGERQAVLARNIANLSTPGFQAADLPDFQQVLGANLGLGNQGLGNLGSGGSLRPTRTDPGHMDGTIDPGMAMRPVSETSQRTLDKNGVRREEQLMKVADTETLHSTVTAIFRSYMTMFNTALGKS